MRCVSCNRKGTYRRAKCWSKWKLCGACAVVQHPHAYKKGMKNIWGKPTENSKNNSQYITKEYEADLKIHPRFHTHCLVCNSSLQNKKFNAKYCSDSCRYKAYMDKESGRKEYQKEYYQKRRRKILKVMKKRECRLCGRNIHKANPNKKIISYYCSQKCMRVDNHIKTERKKRSEVNVRIPLETWIELVRKGRIKVE